MILSESSSLMIFGSYGDYFEEFSDLLVYDVNDEATYLGLF